MAASATEWTVDMLDALPDDGQRYEIIDGKLYVTPSPSNPHQSVSSALYLRLANYLRGSAGGRVLWSPTDIRWGPKRFVQPDVFVLRHESRHRQFPLEFSDLLLVVEVLSPSTAHVDWHIKQPLFQRAGVPEYWIVDIEARSIARWRPSDVLYR